MNRSYTVIALVLLVALAGCGGATNDGGEPEATESGADTAESGGETGSSGGDGGDSGANTGTGGGGADELTMLQFDQAERYEYETVNAMGTEGNLTVVVEPVGNGEVRVDLYYATDSYTENESYTVPAGDKEAFMDAIPGVDESVAVFFVAQSNDITGIYTSQDLPYEVGSVFEQLGLRVNVTGQSTVGGVDCLSYELRGTDSGYLAEDGCITPDLEIPVQWTKYLDDEGNVRGEITLVSYEQG